MTITCCNSHNAARESLNHLPVAALGAREEEVIVTVVLAGAGICEK